MRVALAGLVAGLAIVAAGCGGSENGATAEPVSAHVGGAAAVSPANASVYAALDTSSGSDQWQQLRKLRGGDELVANALDALGARGLDWERDVRPALGPQTALVVLPGARGGVLLTKPADRAKLDALAARAQPPLATGDVEDGWVALARTHDELDAFRAALARGALADDSGFQNAVADLQGDALATVYARPGGLTRALGSPGPGSVAATVSVEHDGLHVEGIAHTAEAHAAYAPELFDRVPADAAAAVSLEGVHGLLASLGTSSTKANALPPLLQLVLGAAATELERLATGEVVVYVRPGGSIPEITLLVHVDDGAAAVKAIDDLASRLGTVERSGSTHSTGVGPLKLSWGIEDGALVVTTASAGITAADAGDRLVDTAAFERAAHAADLGDRVSSLVYADPAKLDSLAATLPAEAREYLDSFNAILFQATASGRTTHFHAFVGVRDR